MRAATGLPALNWSRQYAAACLLHAEVPAQVDPDRVVPLLRAHVDEHPIAQHACVVDHGVQPPEVIDGGGHQPGRRVEVGDVVGVGDRLPAQCGDALDHLGGRACIGAAAVRRAAEVVDDDPRALPRELHRVFGADPPPGPGHDDDPSVADSWHGS